MTKDDLLAIGNSIQMLKLKLDAFNSDIQYILYVAADNKEIQGYEKVRIDYAIKQIMSFYENNLAPTMLKDELTTYDVEAIRKEFEEKGFISTEE